MLVWLQIPILTLSISMKANRVYKDCVLYMIESCVQCFLNILIDLPFCNEIKMKLEIILLSVILLISSLSASNIEKTQVNPLSVDSISFSTHYGGDDYEEGNAISMDSHGNIYVTGFTSSSDFPVTNSSFSQYHGLQDCYVLKFDSIGNLVYSALVGGSG